MQNVDKWMQIKRQSMLLGDELYTIQEVPEIDRILEKQIKSPSELWFSTSQSSSALTVSTHDRQTINPLCLARSQNYLTSPNLNYWKMKLKMMNEKKKYINRWMAETSEKIYKAIEKVKVVTVKMQENEEIPQEAISTVSTNESDDLSSDKSMCSTKLHSIEPTITQIDSAVSTPKVVKNPRSVTEILITASSSSVGVKHSSICLDSFHSATSDETTDSSSFDMSTVRATDNTATDSDEGEKIEDLEEIEEKLKQNRNPLNYLEFDQLPSRPDEAMTSIPENIKSLVMDTMKMLGETDMTEMKRLYGVMKRAGKVDQMLIYEMGKKSFPQNEKPDGDWKIPAPDAYFTFGKALLTVFHATVLLSGGDAPLDDEYQQVSQQTDTLNSMGGVANYWKSSQATSSQRILMRQERKLVQLLSENKTSTTKRYVNPAYAHVKSRYMESLKKKTHSKPIKSNKPSMKIGLGGNDKKLFSHLKPVSWQNYKTPYVEEMPSQVPEKQLLEKTESNESAKTLKQDVQQGKDDMKFDSSLSLGDFPLTSEAKELPCTEKSDVDNKRSSGALKTVHGPKWKFFKNAQDISNKSSGSKIHFDSSDSSSSTYKQHPVSEVDSDDDGPNFYSVDSFELPRKSSFVVFSKDKYVEVQRPDEEDSITNEEETVTYNVPEDKKSDSVSMVRKLYRNLPALRPLIVDSLIANLVVAYVINLTGNAFCEPQKPSGFACTVSHALKGKLRTMLIICPVQVCEGTC